MIKGWNGRNGTIKKNRKGTERNGRKRKREKIRMGMEQRNGTENDWNGRNGTIKELEWEWNGTRETETRED